MTVAGCEVRLISYPSNCVLAAIAAWAKHPRTTRIRFIRNRSHRWHCIWERGGRRFEFYAPNRSRLPYWRNVVYMGTTREVYRPTRGEQPT